MEVKKATIVNWMQLGVYKTREKLFQYKNIKSDLCLACDNEQKENLYHLIFLCTHYEDKRQPVLTKLFLMNSNLVQIKKLKVMLVLDPTSSLLPDTITEHWDQTNFDVHALCRDMLYNMHKKRDKLYTVKEKI